MEENKLHGKYKQVKIARFIFYDSQTWGALRKAWKGYVIAKNKHEYDRMEYYACVIQKLQNELGLRVSSFPDIGMSALKFYPSKSATTFSTDSPIASLDLNLKIFNFTYVQVKCFL
jgi:hypothetical protein